MKDKNTPIRDALGDGSALVASRATPSQHRPHRNESYSTGGDSLEHGVGECQAYCLGYSSLWSIRRFISKWGLSNLIHSSESPLKKHDVQYSIVSAADFLNVFLTNSLAVYVVYSVNIYLSHTKWDT